MSDADESTETLYAGMQDLSGARYSECNHVSDLIDNDVLRAAQERSEALPTSGETERSRYHGAVVFDPVPGVHRNVFYPDYSSLYPLIMLDGNISPETIVGVGEGTLFRTEYDESELRWSYIDPRPVKQLDDGELYRNYTDGEYKMVVDDNGIKWRDDWSRIQDHLEPIYFAPKSERTGILPSRAETYIDWNKSYEGTMYKATKRTRNCFTADTEVLTPHGVRNIRDLSIGDEVYSIDPDSMTVERTSVTETHHYPDADDELVTFENSYVDFRVTPNHRMLVTPEWGDGEEYEFIEAGELGSDYSLPSDWEYNRGSSVDEIDLTDYVAEYEILVEPSVHGHTFADKLGFYPERRTQSKRWDVTSGYIFDAETFEEYRDTIETYSKRMFIHSGCDDGWVPIRYDGDDVIELLGWFTTEGSVRVQERTEYQTTVRGVSHRVKIAQEKEEYRADIRSLLERMDIPYSENARSFRISNKLWYNLLVEWCGTESQNKRLPEWVFEASSEQRSLLFETLISGDGNDRQLRYSTASTDLRDDVMRLAMMEGRNPRYHEYNGVWRVRYGETMNTLRARDRGTATAENGVYCVTVEDNQTLLAGRNGKFQWVGQSLYGVSGDSNFRLFDWRVAEAVTIAGRMLLNYGADTIVERLQSAFDEDAVYVTHADTDGFGVAVDQEVGRGHILPRVREAVEWLNETGMPEYVAEEFGVPASETEHEIELESYAPKLFIPEADDGSGTKKTYAQRITWDEGEECDDLSIKGFEAKRSDIADVTKEVQSFVLETILTEPRLQAKRLVYERVREAVASIENGEYPLDELGQRSGLSKAPEAYGSEDRSPQPIYRGAQYAKQFIEGEETFDKPMKFPVERIRGSTYPRVYDSETAEDGDPVDWIAVEDPDNIPEDIVIDRETIVDKTLHQPLRSIFRTMGWSWSEMIHDHEQTELGGYC